MTAGVFEILPVRKVHELLEVHFPPGHDHVEVGFQSLAPGLEHDPVFGSLLKGHRVEGGRPLSPESPPHPAGEGRRRRKGKTPGQDSYDHLQVG